MTVKNPIGMLRMLAMKSYLVLNAAYFLEVRFHREIR